MPKSLVIVESSAKSKTINRFLGKQFVVKASVGHIKNMPKNRLAVDVEDQFEPEYITIRGRGKILKELKRQAGAVENVYLATDPDREGEAIAYHLAEEIRSTNPNIKRVLFHEITESGIREAIQQPKDIDLSLVEAQKARRVMDRLVGYQVSPFLWQTIYRGLSAGRVQTVALRLICEREAEITGFTAQEYWTIEAELKTRKDEMFTSRLVKINGEDAVIPNEVSAQSHLDALKDLEYIVSDLKSKDVKRNPMPPYTTSTLQQEAARRLNMTTKQIMAVAQQLYEGVDLSEGRVGLITYMRTDSVRLAPTAVAEARQLIAENYGLEYVPPKPLTYKNKKSAQDAHEAIRPASLSHPPNQVAAHLTPAQKKLYELIWNRFIASQMSPAQIRQTTLEVTSGQYLFRTTGSVTLFKGFMQLYEMDKDEDAMPIPVGVDVKDPVDLVKLDPGQHFTKPPARFSESSLVKELDNLGIGRPSTYAMIITTLLDRTYVDREGRSLKPTELGVTVYRILIEQFPELFNVHFTAQMEDELDQIESGEKERVQTMRDFYGPFSESIQRAMGKKEEIRESLQAKTEDVCPQCGKPLVIKWGRNGKFTACTGYPDCRYTKPLETIETAEICPTCGAAMVVKTGRFGRFLACSKYPECKTTKPFTTGVPCPEPGCEGQIAEKKSRKGKMFYGCSKYPACTFATWNRPVATPCPACGNPYLEEKFNKTSGAALACPKCKHTISKEPPAEAA